jgi:hypothetical protein
MSDANFAGDPTAPLPEQSGRKSLLRRKLVFIAVLALALFGLAYMNIVREPLNYYWEFLTAAMALLCIATGWARAGDREGRLRLIWTQVLHWVTILLAMYIVLLPSFQNLLPVPASSLVILMLLALGTFLAGINLLSVEIGFLGLVMAVAVPALAWFKGAALFLLLGAMAVIGLAIAFWPRRGGRSID